MKAILKFKLPKEREEFYRASRSDDLAAFIIEFQGYLRSQVKHGDPPDDIEKIYEYWFDVLGSHDIISDEL